MQITATALTPPTTHTHTHTSLHPGSGEYVCRLSAHFTYQMERTQRRREGVSVLLLRVPQRKNTNVGRQRRACRPAKNERCVCVCVCGGLGCPVPGSPTRVESITTTSALVATAGTAPTQLTRSWWRCRGDVGLVVQMNRLYTSHSCRSVFVRSFGTPNNPKRTKINPA